MTHCATSRPLSGRTQKRQSPANSWKRVHAGRWHAGRSLKGRVLCEVRIKTDETYEYRKNLHDYVMCLL
jgi:hypothetical protein